MNKERRKRLSEANGFLEKALSIITSIADEERYSLENLPESLQDGSGAEKMENIIDLLEEAADCTENASESIDEVINM